MPAELLLNFALLLTPPASATDATATAPLQPAAILRAASPVRRVEGTAAAGLLHPRLEIVEAGTEDIGGIATTLRTDPFDPRLPTAFQRVYRVPGSDTMLMRGNGALFAVFDTSTYKTSKGGTMPSLPPGTVFHIGMPSESNAALRFGAGAPSNEVNRATVDIDGQVVPVRVRNRVDGRVDTRRVELTPAKPLVPAPAASATVPTDSDAPLVAPLDEPLDPLVDRTTADPYAHLKFGPARITRGE